MRKGKIYIGTSGWQYKHWRGSFYPAGLKIKEEFTYYLSQFDTVEINNSFYKLPDLKTFSSWRKATPTKFLFAVKASRYITHMKKLKIDKQSIRKFFTRVNKLDKKLGPVLFQLPPHWKLNLERFENFLAHLPNEIRYTFEFRNASWYTEEVYQLLRQYKCAFCIYELAHHLSPLEITANFVYVRLHGPGNKYQGSYSDNALKEWAQRCLKWQRDKKEVFVYFDNDQAGYAAFNARTLMSIIQKSNYNE